MEDELKTLNDMPKYEAMYAGYPLDKDMIDPKELKEEVIKWIQEDIDEGDKNSNVDLIIKWQKRFNLIIDEASNITEKDLK